LTEFKGNKIGFITNVAFDIAIFEDQVSLLNYRGSGTLSLTPAMSKTCRAIVSHFFGALTHSVASSRGEVFHSLDSKSVRAKLLDSPSQQEDDTDESENEKTSITTLPTITPLEVN